ncbi:hypothetical protein [Flavobacterium sp. K5-23]|uniref:hypothetical protein n=1 Tax=Flavobacterium sp. K5-23 TaxID=2746225 RepID=UPI00200C4BC6|nr:hypothetical protein [Flavobacterium sp. K5-23]UQD57234.1 hypothetical protein FLAK523_12855 [Flavobacterium sp. K5-23]
MKWIAPMFYKIKYILIRFYRILNVKKRSEFVWKDLIEYNLDKGWRFGQFETEKRIENKFNVDGSILIKFDYIVTYNDLEYSSIILESFEEDKTSDIMILASHINSLLNFGVVKVSVKHNYVEYTFSRDLVTYMLYPLEIENDHFDHYNFTKDCVWSFNRLMETGEDPVFVFSELLQRKEEKEKADNSSNLIE